MRGEVVEVYITMGSIYIPIAAIGPKQTMLSLFVLADKYCIVVNENVRDLLMD